MARSVPTIVVGVDGSDCARSALAFAAEEAVIRGARLRVVSAWELRPNVLFVAEAVQSVAPAVLDGFREVARNNVREAVAEVRRHRPGVLVEDVVLETHPADGLLEQARDAALLVVGHRGRGGFASLQLGSVSQQVVLHAPCPVVVVRRRGATVAPLRTPPRGLA